MNVTTSIKFVVSGFFALCTAAVLLTVGSAQILSGIYSIGLRYVTEGRLKFSDTYACKCTFAHMTH